MSELQHKGWRIAAGDPHPSAEFSPTSWLEDSIAVNGSAVGARRLGAMVEVVLGSGGFMPRALVGHILSQAANTSN